LKLLAENNRFGFNAEIPVLFKFINESKDSNVLSTDLYSAEKLDEESSLKKLYALLYLKNTEKNIKLQQYIDKSLLNWSAFGLGDLVIDGSLKAKLKSLKLLNW
jgi:F0F1-type ATP synthase delta subunit